MNSPDIEKIPSALKAWPNWVVWRIEERDGKAAKVPYNPEYPGQKAKSGAPSTWGTFRKALNVAQTDGFMGVGFEFSVSDPFAGVDLDNCRNPETGEIEPWAMDIINRLNSYTETSPSGRGFHIWVLGKVPPGRRRKGQVEMYSQGRYFTISGLHLEGTPATIENRQQELEVLHREVFGEAQKPRTPPTSPTPAIDLSDQELIDRAHQATHGETFAKLWGGTWQEDYPSQSEATAALLSKLTFWFGPNPERIDRLFRQSGLMRDKWDRPQSGSTWGALEIQRAISRAVEFYTPRQRPLDDASRHEKKRQDQEAPAAEKEKFKPSTTVIPAWPQEVMTGAAGMFARAYAAYLETPEPFLFMNYLTLLGHVLSNLITLKSEISPQPRLFSVNLGESADTRKSTSINITAKFFLEVVAPGEIAPVWGVGSAEGLVKAFIKNPRAILIQDELKAIVQKMKIDTSVLLPCVNTLFESNRFHSLTKTHDIKIDNAELCLLAASTLDTYRNIFTPQFLDIGFINRLFIVLGDSERKFSIPAPMPEEERESLRRDLLEVLQFVRELTTAGRYSLPIDARAQEIFDEWYFSLEKSTFTKRLDTYGHRFLPLLAVNEIAATITPEIAERTVALLNYQLAARKFADPIDADNALAKLEEKIRRLLANGPLQKRDLEKYGHKFRVGSYLWSMAIKNLTTAEEIHFDAKTKLYRWLYE